MNHGIPDIGKPSFKTIEFCERTKLKMTGETPEVRFNKRKKEKKERKERKERKREKREKREK